MFFAPAHRSHFSTTPYRAFDRSYDRSFERFVNEALSTAAPRGLQLTQDDKAFTVTMDLPGLSREDLRVDIEGNVVRLQSAETASRKVKAAYELATEIDAAASSAKLENGVLTLTLVKLVPVSKATQIQVQ